MATKRFALNRNNFPSPRNESKHEYLWQHMLSRFGDPPGYSSGRIAWNAELAWLSGKQGDPEWPPFPPSQIRSRPRFVSSKGRREERVEKPPRPDVYMDHQAAALWLGSAGSLYDVAKRPWLRDIIKTYTLWTKAANGSELDKDEDVENPPREWNDAYFKLLAYCLPGLTSEQIDEIALAPIIGLPDEAFLDVMTVFLRNVDAVYFTDRGLQDAQAVHTRNVLGRRLMATRRWERHSRDRSKSIETHLGPTIAVLLFNDYGHFQPAKCYLYKGIDRLDPFLPLLKGVAEGGPFLFVAIALLNLLEVAPRTIHLPLIIAAGKSWLAGNPNDDTFWTDHDVGRRLCSLIQAILALDPKLFGPDQALTKEIDGLLADLVRIGVPEAHRSEEALRLVR